jgi:hypothetical protein
MCTNILFYEGSFIWRALKRSRRTFCLPQSQLNISGERATVQRFSTLSDGLRAFFQLITRKPPIFPSCTTHTNEQRDDQATSNSQHNKQEESASPKSRVRKRERERTRKPSLLPASLGFWRNKRFCHHFSCLPVFFTVSL